MFISMIASHVPSLYRIQAYFRTKSKVFSLGLIRSAKKADFIRMKAWCLAKTYKLFDEQTEQVLNHSHKLCHCLVTRFYHCSMWSSILTANSDTFL